MKLLIPFLFVSTAFGQPPRAIELFGTFGVMRGGGDEGSAGSGGAYGGAVTVPFTVRWALDVQALTSRLSDGPDFRMRRVLVSPGLQYRRGNQRTRWFIAFGPGLQRDRSSGTFQAFNNSGESRTVSFEETRAGLTLHWRTGIVVTATRRVLVRGEVFWVNRYVLPNLGVAISLGVPLSR